MTRELAFIELLEKFNRKERFFLLGWSLGHRRFRGSSAFLKSISSLLGIEIPTKAFVAMDYHLSWLYASVFLSSGKTDDRGVHSNEQQLVTGTQEDVDLLIAFRRGRKNHVVMVEAKAATGWRNNQARSKAARLSGIFGRDGKRWPSVQPHYVLASPRRPHRLDMSAWPGWMKQPDGSPHWIKMPMPAELIKTTRCDKDGVADAKGTFWIVALGLSPRRRTKSTVRLARSSSSKNQSPCYEGRRLNHMQREHFPPGVAKRLGWYVYRLIDPRNGETFYVGKGRGDRVFDHVRSALAETEDEDAADLKLQRIKDIASAGLAVGHVVHRHNIEDEDVALQIEAALIDAYPGTTNKVGGHGSGDYGCRHVEEIVSEYDAQPFVAKEPLILISIAQSYATEERDIYDAVRAAWRINADRAATFGLVLAHRRGVVLGAFRPRGSWLPATRDNSPWLEKDIPGRHGFVGDQASPADASNYVGKQVPDIYRKQGIASPIQYVTPEDNSDVE